MNSEWHIPDPSIPVRQGDLLICRTPHSGVLQEICLVITADCDISKGKFGRQLACLRLMPLHKYLRTTWAEKKLQAQLRNEIEKVRSQIAKWHTRYLGTYSQMTAEAAVDWIKREKPEAICSALQIPEDDKNKFREILEVFRAAIYSLDDLKDADPFECLIALRSKISGKDCTQDISKQAQDETKSKLPEDVFILTTLPQLDVGSTVVLLREIIAVPYEAVCYRTCDATTDEKFLRIGRLQPTFKHAVSQTFGHLYSKIGLPDDYEERRNAIFEQVSENIVEATCAA